MSDEKRDNSGALFAVKERKKENSPHYTGQVTVNGVDMWVSGWMKQSAKTGTKYMSLAFNEKKDKDPIVSQDECPF